MAEPEMTVLRQGQGRWAETEATRGSRWYWRKPGWARQELAYVKVPAVRTTSSDTST